MSKPIATSHPLPDLMWLAAVSREYLRDTQQSAFIIRNLSEPVARAIDEAERGDEKIDDAEAECFVESVDWLLEVLDSRAQILRECLTGLEKKA